jgi:HSP20 family protein
MASKIVVRIFRKNTDQETSTTTESQSRWNPIHQDTPLNALFDNMIPSLSLPRPQNMFIPPMDISENEQQFCIRLELAGVKPDALMIEWQDYDLMIKGHREEESPKKPTHYHQLEIHYGTFERLVRLPRTVNPEATKACYKDGFLEIVIPKTPRSRTRTIPVIDEDNI